MKTRNSFSNNCVEPWYKWIFRRNDSLPGATVYFLSRRNSTSARFFPLYDRTSNFRVVLIRGLPIPYTDGLMLKFHIFFSQIFIEKLNKYRWLALSNTKLMEKTKTNVLLNVDDPVYNHAEKNTLLRVFELTQLNQKKLRVVVTNDFTRARFQEFLPPECIKIVSQGFTERDIEDSLEKNKKFSVVYSSPYIDYYRDKHERSDSWNAVHLIDFIIPELEKHCPDLEVHLIGKLGLNAHRQISKNKNVIVHGLKSIHDNAILIKRCHLGLYPRTTDQKRSVMKVYEYVGCGLPVVTYDHIDTSMVRENGFGISVRHPHELIEAIRRLKDDLSLYQDIRNRIDLTKRRYSWDTIVKDYDRIVLE